jgi:tetratricopeptide (TPR) repeat protein
MSEQNEDRGDFYDPRPLWNFDDAAESLARFTAAREAETHWVARSILATQMARAHGLMGNFEAGHALLHEEERGAVANNQAAAAWGAIERGRLIRSSGGPIEDARRYFEYAAGHSRRVGLEALHIDALHMIALTLEPEQAVVFTIGAIEKAKASTAAAARNWVASLLNNLGMAYADLEEWDAARAAFDEALVEREKQGNQDRTHVARYMVGWAMRNQGQTAAAREWMESLKADILAAGKTDEYVDAELEILKQN